MTMTKPCQFALPSLSQRLESLGNAASVRKELTVEPDAIQGLAKLPASTAADQLAVHLGRVCSPTDSQVHCVQELLGIALSHGIRAYASTHDYIRNATAEEVEVRAEPVTRMVFGLGGVGKTAMREAVERIFNTAEVFQPSPHVPPRQLRGAIFVTLRQGITSKQVLNEIRSELGMDTAALGGRDKKQVNLVRRELYRQGVLLIVIDESQYTANGLRAGAAFVNVISEVRRLGIPVIFIANFSLAHQLKAQHSQHTQRLLFAPLRIAPIQSHDEMISRLELLKKAAGGILSIEPKTDHLRISWLCGGNGRALLALINCGYARARESSPGSGEVVVGLAELEKAYLDSAFAEFRGEIELLRRFASTPEKLPIDLRDPFPETGAEAIKASADAAYKTNLALQRLLASMTVEEREAVMKGEVPPPLTLGDVDQTAAKEHGGPEGPPATGNSAAQRALRPTRPKRERRPEMTLEDVKRTRAGL